RRRSGRGAGARGGARAAGPDHQRASRRRLLEGRPQDRGALPVGAGAPDGAGRKAHRRAALQGAVRARRLLARPQDQRRLALTSVDATLRVAAPAKINLYLRVTGRRSDGYHLLDSLAAFADVHDTLLLAQIGRASCRERVQSSVRAGSVYK